ncbi:MAG: hypothetical protein K5705_12725 [Oscillospiraceae bacterium]|nr:hypothetical protein [Oscillospiraceae bacterium]
MKTIMFNLPDALADKFELALQLTGDNRDAVAEEFVRSYLGRALQSAANEFRAPETQPQIPPRQPQPSPGTVPPPPPPLRGTPNHQRTTQRSERFSEWGKANTRIPRWARNPQQNNHKILRAFFELKQELGNVTIDALRRRCSDPNGHPNTYVPHFDNNFTQMKFDNGNSHGKVFEEHDGYITIWDRISDTLQRYRDFFE